MNKKEKLRETKKLFWAYILLFIVAEVFLIIGAIIIGFSFLGTDQFIKSSKGIIGIGFIVASVLIRVLGEIVKKEIMN